MSVFESLMFLSLQGLQVCWKHSIITWKFSTRWNKIIIL